MNVDIKSFNDLEDTTIYWVGGFIKKYGNKRPKVRVYTNTKGFVWYYDVALGRLPWMYLGARYRQGQFTEVGGSGSVHFTIRNMSDIDFISFDKVPFELRRQRKNPDLVKELVCRYSQNGNTYYIPQMEFIRSFFGMNNTVLNYLLMPSGIDGLCKCLYRLIRTIGSETFGHRIGRRTLLPQGSLFLIIRTSSSINQALSA